MAINNVLAPIHKAFRDEFQLFYDLRRGRDGFNQYERMLSEAFQRFKGGNVTELRSSIFDRHISLLLNPVNQPEVKALFNTISRNLGPKLKVYELGIAKHRTYGGEDYLTVKLSPQDGKPFKSLPGAFILAGKSYQTIYREQANLVDGPRRLSVVTPIR